MPSSSLRRSAAVRSACAAAVLAALIGILAPATALAEEPPQLTARLTDLAGVMTPDDVAQAEAAIADLDEEANVQLFVLFVNTLDGMTVTDYSDEVARRSSLGGNDALIVVAVQDRRTSIWVGDLLTDLTDEEVDRIVAEDLGPNLADGAWGAAIEDAAEGLDQSLGSAGSAIPWGPIIGIGLVALGAWALVGWWRSRRKADLEEEERDRRLGGLARDANARLIALDELIRNDAQELGFAEAQFGKEAASAFAAALDKARAELKTAFAVRQRLDDGEPESVEQREAMLREIIQRTSRAEGVLEEQTARFRELRDLERRAPEVLAAQPEAISAAEARLEDVERLLADLRTDAPRSSEAVTGHVAEARKRLRLAATSTEAGQAALQRNDRIAAGRAALAARDAVAQASQLLDSIAREHAVLEEARINLSAALDQARADVAAAEEGLGSADAALSEELETARARLRAAEETSGGDQRDVVHAYRLAREAEAAADRVVAGAKEGRERRARAAAGADAAIRAAEVAVDRAEDFIRSRRHAIGRRPRTRLSEAEESLARAGALREGDPERATQEAQRAAQLADDAYRLAAGDFAHAEEAGYGGMVIINGRPYSMGRGSEWGSDVGGAIIGSIIGSILAGRGGGGPFGGFGGGGFGG
ncbi:MAG TPA: TPM domain-containing protein, partial [Candidatus Limnocylindria bacterium]|nr:TPM domain-containing protein [Candidatus Limnocylindria bacterium]